MGYIALEEHYALPEMKTPPKSKFLQLFERDQGRCVYCGLDLKADFDRFMMATEDHLVLMQGTHPGLADYQ